MYDDFPILKDEDYLTLMQQYNEAKLMDKTGQIGRVFLLLTASKQFCFAPSVEYNAKILNALKLAKQNIETALNNLSTSFNFKEDKVKEIRQFNIFEFLFKLTEASNILFELSLIEDKVYNKKICTACVKLLSGAIKEVLLALQNSEVKLYKFM